MNISYLENDKNEYEPSTIKLIAKYNSDKDLHQINLDDTNTTEYWLEVINILFNTNKNTIIKALHEYKEVIVKIGEYDILHREYMTYKSISKEETLFLRFDMLGKYLSKYLTNFMNYKCMESDYSIEHNKIKFKILVMPYYELGNFKEFQWKNHNSKIYLSCIKQLCYTYLFAYHNFGFIHNKCHLKNILVSTIDDKYNIYNFNGKEYIVPTYGYNALIMDYETSLLDVNKQNTVIFLNDLGKILYDIYTLYHNINIINIINKLDVIIRNKNNYLELVDVINKEIELL